MRQQLQAAAGAAILYDAEAAPDLDEHWFSPTYWRARDALHPQSGGRGGVAIIDSPVGPAVLRHYRRGGAIARVLGDRYFWTGAVRTRGFAEFHLLARLRELALPVPEVLAARYVRRGLFYRADLLMRLVANAQTLAERVTTGALDAALAVQVGTLIARFHRAHIRHADLNAHNILITPTGLYLIDFDRGAVRARRHWQQGNLQRLHRSLCKLGAAADPQRFERTFWQPLVSAYRMAVYA